MDVEAMERQATATDADILKDMQISTRSVFGPKKIRLN
jgi:hypothetical protein